MTRASPLSLSALLLALCLPWQAAQAQNQRLIDLYRQALQTNPALRASQLGVDQATAQGDVARSRLLPQVTANGSYAWNDSRDAGASSRAYNSVRSGLQVQQAVLDLPAYYKLQAARYGVSQSERLQQAERQTLASEIVDRYLTVLQAADEINNVLSEKTVVEGQRKRLRFMRERELVKLTDLYEVEAYFQGLLTRELETRHVHAVALARLRELTGVKTDGVPALVREELPPVPGSDETWVGDATASNPTLLALQEAIQAAQMDLRSSRAGYLPRLSLSLSQTHSDQGFDNKLVPAYSIGTVSLQLTIPLYEGGRAQADVKDAGARLAMAREKLEGARREVERDARTAYLNASTHHARIRSTADEVQALTKVVEATTRSFELGVSTIIDVLAAQKRQFKARSDRQKARYDYIREVTRLRARSGRLGDPDIEEIDGWMDSATTPARPAPLALSGVVEQRVAGQKAQ